GNLNVIRFGNRDQSHVNRLDNAFGRDVVFKVITLLDFAAPAGLVDRALHRVCHGVGVKNRAAIDVAGSATHSLDERVTGPQKSFLIRVKNGDERDFRQVEAFTKQVDADQHIELSAPQATQ